MQRQSGAGWLGRAEALQRRGGAQDSRYVVDGVNRGWVYRWRRVGWVKRDGGQVPNRDIWENPLEILEQHEVSMVWIEGHAGELGNERADELARRGVSEARKVLVGAPDAGA